MRYITAKSSNEAWRKTFTSLLDSKLETDNNKYFRDEVVLIKIAEPELEELYTLFPMDKHEIEVINKYITSGENENSVSHEWTKLYYHRAFDNPNSQIEFLIDKLLQPEPVGECQISMWDKNIDQKSKISPCTQILWARIKHNKLEWHTHAHSSDAYKKLLMNLQEFIALQHYVAAKINTKVGDYYHFLDSCHIHYNDREAAILLRSKLSN
ncbi:MAG: hypothetical protein Kow0081_0170 [Candidatus Dojkabacteria bacterium]